MLDKIPSVEVAEWSEDFLSTVVSNVTNSHHDASVLIKDHIVYLNSYLTCLGVKTVIVEGSYIDQNYLDDYQGYYSSCFPYHSKCCTRVHFFSNKFNEVTFLKHLKDASENEISINNLNDSYLGYIVIRPIPDTFIAKLCLKVYEKCLADNYQMIKKGNTVNLFGLQLKVESAPFTEKDKVVSACATSSIWMLLCSSSHFDRNSYPSPSAITKLALNGNDNGVKGFPVLGLEPSEVCRAIQHNGLEASQVLLNYKNFDRSFDILKSLAVAYLTNDIPFILAGQIYKYDIETEQVTHDGEHAVCLLGYRYDKSTLKTQKYLNKSEAIDRVYVHDDRYGPYLALEFSDLPFTVRETSENSVTSNEPKTVNGLKVFLYNTPSKGNECELKEVFVLDRIILGKHHKVRISYEDVEKLVHNFINLISIYVTFEGQGADNFEDIETQVLESLSFEIKLTSNNKLKSNYYQNIQNEDFFSFNSVEDKSSFLCKSLPKHIWECSIYSSNQLMGSLLFDATEIIQGHPLIGYIALRKEFNQLWLRLAKKGVCDQLEEKFNVIGGDETRLFKTYLKFLAESDSFIMNIRYGEPKLIYRKFKSIEKSKVNELDFLGKIINKPNVQIQKFNSSWNETQLDTVYKYIWLIDTDGDLYYGIEIEGCQEYGGGHPTLNSGRLARVGGELNYESGKWVINLFSGAYSRHIDTVDGDNEILRNVLKYNFNGWDESAKPLIKSETTTDTRV